MKAQSGSYLSSLRRTRSIPFNVADAWTVDTLLERLKTLSN